MKSAALLSLLIHSAMLLSIVKSFTLQSARGAGIRCASGVSYRAACGSGYAAIGGWSSSPTPSFVAPSARLQPQPKTPTRRETRRPMSSPSEAETSVVETCREKIAAALETDDVKVIGAYDDPNGSHISIVVTSSLFEGKRPVQRQQLVYKALWEELQGAVHAVDSMVCKTPEEK